MGNISKISTLNPVQFYWAQNPFFAGKNQYLLGEDWFIKQIPDWYQKIFYFQKWQKTDNIYLQVQTNFDPVSWQIVDCNRQLLLAGVFTTVNEVPAGDLYTRYETTIQLAAEEIPTNRQIYILINVGVDDNGNPITQWISEPMSVRNSWPQTLEFRYNFPIGDYYDTWFNADTVFTFRCEARLNQYTPGSVAKVYQDQPLNTVVLSSVPFDQWKLTIGHSYGVPDWVAKKLNTILGCAYVYIERVQFSKIDAAKLEPVRLDKYPMSGWSIDVQPSKNLFSDIADTALNNSIVVVYNIDGKVVGTFNNTLPSNAEIRIIDTE